MKKNIYRKLFSLFLCLLALSTYANAGIASMGFNGCCDQNNIIVSGEATVSVKPDIAVISVGISSKKKTSKQAVTQVNDKINQINKILSENSIKQTDITTSSLNIYPQYSYENGVSQISGQNAQQSLIVKVRNINSTGGNLGPLIDSLVSVDRIQLNGLTFDKEDKSAAQTQARKQAFNNAKNKANQYAGLASRTLGRTITIIDGASNEAAPVPLANYKSSQAASLSVSAPTSIQVGDLDVSYSVQVSFALR